MAVRWKCTMTSGNKQLEDYGSSMKVYTDFWQQTTWIIWQFDESVQWLLTKTTWRLWQFGESVQWLLTTNNLKTMVVRWKCTLTSDNKQPEDYGSSMKVYNDFWQQTTWRIW